MPLVRPNLTMSDARKTPYNKVPGKTPGKPNGSISKMPLRPTQGFNSFRGPVNSTMIVNRAQSVTDMRGVGMLNRNPQPKQSLAFSDASNFSMNLNLSSSTSIDHPVKQSLPVPSFSPLMRQIESTIDNKLKSFLSSFQSNTLIATPQVVNKENGEEEEEGAWGGAPVNDDETIKDLTFEIPDFPVTNVRELFPDLRKEEDDAIEFQPISSGEDLPPITSTCIRPSQTRMESLPGSENLEMGVRKRTNLEALMNESDDQVIPNQEDVFAVPSNPARRRSSRLSRRPPSLDEFSVQVLPTKRRSRTSSGRSEHVSLDDSLPRPLRRSARQTLLRSIQEQEEPEVPAPKIKVEKPVKVKREPKIRIKNEVIASYFNSPAAASTKVTQKSMKNAKKAHREAILKVLNTGSFKELQMLPCIGLKTAYQIVTQRTLNGKFKKIEDLGKIPMMKGKMWQKFLDVSFYFENLNFF